MTEIFRRAGVIDINLYAQRSAEIVAAGRFLYSRGWSPATSSNYSARIDAQHIAITVSGKHKGELTEAGVMAVDLSGNAVLSACKSSAETLLHTVIYELFPDVGAVLHTHSVGATVLSRAMVGKSSLPLQDYELQKAFSGQVTHENEIIIPIFENTQDIAALAAQSKDYFSKNPEVPAYLIRGHGLYTWGKNMQDCLRHIEALEFLIQCEIEMIRISK
ncbi:MAG: methylthioribulose 1-phosphate dehydratase [Hahellaceae bacterium]|jgi:methylthioribulose-1-phosphate dehydratase|nr:methylthioribulose 1-phosphate dehydratase [Hahellaceae bacterium]MCP5213159.1 methylthioribulose 1-phosphate dehydratase [Hahellaceae bacterium]